MDVLRLSGPQLEQLARLRLHDRFPYLRSLNLYDKDGESLSPAEFKAFAATTLPRLQLLEALRMDGLGYLPSTALVAMLRNATQLKDLDTTGERICDRRSLYASHAFSACCCGCSGPMHACTGTFMMQNILVAAANHRGLRVVTMSHLFFRFFRFLRFSERSVLQH